jgi:hypothetical protein
MLEHVRTKAPARKLRLYGCACVRRAWDQLTPDGRLALERTERVADGLLPQVQISDALRDLAHPAMEVTLGTASILAQAIVRLFAAPDEARHAATDVLRALRQQWREELAAQCELARCVFGNPFRPVPASPPWSRSETARQMAQVITDEGRYADLPILADALEDAGCDDEDVLGHCRGGGSHARGCWVIDVILGRG